MKAPGWHGARTGTHIGTDSTCNTNGTHFAICPCDGARPTAQRCHDSLKIVPLHLQHLHLCCVPTTSEGKECKGTPQQPVSWLGGGSLNGCLPQGAKRIWGEVAWPCPCSLDSLAPRWSTPPLQLLPLTYAKQKSHHVMQI